MYCLKNNNSKSFMSFYSINFLPSVKKTCADLYWLFVGWLKSCFSKLTDWKISNNSDETSNNNIKYIRHIYHIKMTDFKFGSHGLAHFLTPRNPKYTLIIQIHNSWHPWGLISISEAPLGTPWIPKETTQIPKGTPKIP